MRVKSHSAVKTPHGNAMIWRYMGLGKFLDLITHRRLFFSNAARLTDQYEATLPASNIAAIRTKLENENFDPGDLETEVSWRVAEIDGLRDLTLVNCWSIGRHESYARWKIYLGGSKDGVAVKSTVGRLKKSLMRGADCYPEDVYLATVNYAERIDTSSVHRFQVVTTKKPYYEFETEMRAFIVNFPRSEGGTKTPYEIALGRYVSIELDELVDEIYVSPFAGSWLEASVRDVVASVCPSLKGRLVASGIRDK